MKGQRVATGTEGTLPAYPGAEESGEQSMRGRVLIIFPGALGDLICLIPALRALARRYSGCGLELMARAELADFAVGRMGIARGHSIDRREVSSLFSPAGDAPAQARDFFGAFAAIHSFFGFDNRRIREILPHACRGQVFFHPFRPNAGGHVSAAYIEAIGGRVDFGTPAGAARLELCEDDLGNAQRLAGGFGIEPGSYVLLMPGSGSPGKNWPVENYLELCGHLTRSMPILIVLGPAEADLQAGFAQFPVIRSPSLGALAGLARMSSAFVGNDSGTSHLAAAAGASGVVIFGPTDPARWRPLGAVSVLRRMPMRELPWQEVASAVQLARKRAEWQR